MNSKLAIALFTCSIIGNSSAFAMLTDDIDTDGIHGQPSSSSTLQQNDDLEESPDFGFVLHEALRREVEDEMRVEKLKQDLNTKRLELGFSAI